MASNDNDGAWFRPKSYGYGAGLPIAWQGWALLALYLVAILGAVPLVPNHIAIWVGIVIAATVVMIFISKAKTRGGWRWRRGTDDL